MSYFSFGGSPINFVSSLQVLGEDTLSSQQGICMVIQGPPILHACCPDADSFYLTQFILLIYMRRHTLLH